MKKTKLLTLLASVFLLAGCGSSEPEPEPVEIYEVKVNPSAVEVRVGEGSKNVNYNVFGKGDFSKEVEIKSLDETIATVKKAEEGLSFAISPVKEGQTSVTVKSKADESKVANVSVTVLPEKIIVVDPEITSVTASSAGFELAIGAAPQSVTITVEGKGEYNKGVDINVTNPEIASVDKSELVSGESFNVSAVSKGNTEVRITSKQDKTKGAVVPVLVTGGGVLPEEVDITLSATGKSAKVGEPFDLTATVTGTSDPVVWTVEGTEGVIALSNTSDTGATVTPIEVGEATVKASVAGKSATCRVTVSEPDFYTAIQMKLNDSQTIDMVKSAYKEGQEYLAQFTHTFESIEKDTRVDFYGKLSGAFNLITENIGPSPDDMGNLTQNNLKPATAEGIDWTVLKSAENVTLYFEIYSDGSSFWLQGGPEIDVPKAHIKGIGGDWTEGLEMKINTEKQTEYYLDNVSISTTDEFKINLGDVWAGYANVKDEALALVNESASDGNIMVKKAGTYSIYWDSAVEGDPAKSIWIEKTGEEEVAYTLKLNDGEAVDLTLDDEGMPEGPLHQYSTNVAVRKGDVVKFYADGELISAIGVDREGDTPKPNNNILESDGLFIIHNDYSPEEGHKSIYLKEYDGGYSVWGSGYEEIAAVYSLKINDGEAVALGLDDTDKPVDALHQYSTDEAVKQGDVITFYKDGTLITSIGVDRDGESQVVPGNNVIENLGSFVIHNDYSPEEGHKSIYLKEYEGGYSIWGCGYEDAPTPELTGYQIKIGEETIALVKVEITPEGMLEQYSKVLASVKAGDRVDFYAVYNIGNPVLISANISPNGAGDHENNLAPLTSGGTDWAVVQDAENVTLYFEVRDGGFGFWLEGGPEVLTGYYLKVNADLVPLTATDDFEEYKQYFVADLGLFVGDVLKIYNATTKEEFCPALQEGSSNKIDGQYGDELDVLEDGNFTIYLKLKYGEDLIWISENVEPVKSVEFGKTEYDATVGQTSLEVSVTCTNVSDVEYESSDACVTIDASSDDTKVVFNAVSEGTAVITATAEGAEPATLTVTVSEVPEPDVKTLYFTDSRGWGTPYVYMFDASGTALTDWPGDAMTLDHVNGDSQNVYRFTADVATYSTFVFSGNGEQTVDVKYEYFGANNACWVTNSKTEDDGHYYVDFWNYVEPEPVKEIKFASSTMNATVDEIPYEIGVTATLVSGITYSSNSACVSVDTVNSDDTRLIFTAVSAGTAVVTASAEDGAVTATLTVTVTEAHVHSYDTTTHYCTCGDLDPNYKEIYFDANGSSLWDQANAKFFVHAWHEATTVDVELERIGVTSEFVAVIPAECDNFIFTRNDPSSTGPWDKEWNRSYELNGIPTGMNGYKITAWGAPEQPSYGEWYVHA